LAKLPHFGESGEAGRIGSSHGKGHDLVLDSKSKLVMSKISPEEKLAFISCWLSAEVQVD